MNVHIVKKGLTTFPRYYDIFKTRMEKGNVLNTNYVSLHVSNLSFPAKNCKKKKKRKNRSYRLNKLKLLYALTFSFNFYAFTQAFN